MMPNAPTWWRPEIQGAVPIRSASAPFMRAFRQRVAAGLLTGRPHPRSHYVIDDFGPDHVNLRAADWWTAVNVGLNHVEIRREALGSIQYSVRYWQWAQYALGLSAVLGSIGLTLLLGADVRDYIVRNPNAMMPGLSLDQNVALAWLMVLFWGFAWPWILIALHKRPLRRLVTRLIAEVDAQAAPEPAQRPS